MSEPVLLIGAGAMAIEYARVLRGMGRDFVVLGRGEESANAFREATGVAPSTGPLEGQLAQLETVPSEAIIAVNVVELADATCAVAQAGVARILVEKPAALDFEELSKLIELTTTKQVEIKLGYNRRFLSSVLAARQMIAQDGGVLSVKFDFSEPARRIGAMGKPERELTSWFYANSTHVVDLALSFVGPCDVAAGLTSGGVEWHPTAGVWVGFAKAESGALLSWHANWVGPGRWGVEVVTRERRLILRPLEGLSVQDHSSFAEREVDIDLGPDAEFKPGLFRQVDAFLSGTGAEHLPDIRDHARNWPVYEAIRKGAEFAPTSDH